MEILSTSSDFRTLCLDMGTVFLIRESVMNDNRISSSVKTYKEFEETYPVLHKRIFEFQFNDAFKDAQRLAKKKTSSHRVTSR
jgi:hypothetical protein